VVVDDVDVPHEKLSAEALAAVIEEFVTRDGAVQGHRDVPLEQRRSEILRQLRDGTAVIVFDEDGQTVDIVARRRGSDGNLSPQGPRP
jgi:uncharacterized protein YheU (UPF0270 family)